MRLNNILIVNAFLWLLTTNSNAQDMLIQIDTIKGKLGVVDTIIKQKTQLSFGKVFPNNYRKNETDVEALKPYLVNDILDPTNLSHPLYLEILKEAEEKLQDAKADLLNLMKISESTKQAMLKINIANEDDLSSITFVYIPVYYITPNIVFFKNGDNIAKYYNLSRSGFKYLMLQKNRLVGYVDFNTNLSTQFKSRFTASIFPNATESYNQIVKLQKTPIAILQSVYTTEAKNLNSSGHVPMFGYIEQGYLVFSYFEEGMIQQVRNDGYSSPNLRFYKDYTIETAESFFAASFSSGSLSMSIINQLLDNALKRL